MLSFKCKNRYGFTVFIAMTTILLACCQIKLHSTNYENDSIFKINIDSTLYNKWGFKYPVTYVFVLPADASNIKVLRCDKLSEEWTKLQEKTANDFFNGIEYVRFDYKNNKAYVSVGFNTTNNIYIKFENNPFVTFNSIASYYDSRKAVYTLSNDNWGGKLSSRDGTWIEMTDDSSDKYRAAIHAARMYDLPLSIAINSVSCYWETSDDRKQRKQSDQKIWDNMQAELNNCTDNFCWEPAVHTRTHPDKDSVYSAHGYKWEILGCRDDILANLTNIPYGQYIFEFILPGAYKDENLRKISANEFIFLRDWTGGDNPESINFASWNEEYLFYGIGGLETISYDSKLQSENPPGRYNKSHVDELNNAFDAIYNKGGIFYAMWHSDRYSNSVIYSTYPPESGTASTLMQHFAHVANRKDVWYVANGWLYSYRMVAERAGITNIYEK